MIAITERAKKALLAKKLDAGVMDVDIGLRLTSAVDGTLMLVLDRPHAGDQVVKYRDSTVLVADRATAAAVSAGRMLDCRRSAEGRLDIVIRSRQLGEHPDGSSEEPRSA